MNNLKTFLTLFVLVFILKIIAFFAGSETAYLSITKIKMRKLVNERRKNAKIASVLKENIDELLTIILIGTNFMNTLASALATALAVQIASSTAVRLSGASAPGLASAVSTIVITFFATTFGQIVPKTAALIKTEKNVLKNAMPLFVLEKIFFPIVWIFSLLSKFTAGLAKKIWKFDNVTITEEELAALFEVGANEGTLEADESRMLNKIFKFNDLIVHDLMKHRSLVQSVSHDSTKNEVVKKFNETGLKLIAVYRISPENIVGVIHYKSLLLGEKSSDTGKGYAQNVMHEVMFVPETLTALELLSKFRKQKTEFAVALNEQGSLSGVVTMDDILRVVFGRITEEKNSLPAEKRIKLVGSGEFLVPGELQLDDLNDFFGFGLKSDEFMTLGGWLLERFGYLPSVGEKIRWKNAVFTVEEQAQRRILSVRIKLSFSK